MELETHKEYQQQQPDTDWMGRAVAAAYKIEILLTRLESVERERDVAVARVAQLEAMARSCLGLLNEMHFATQGCTAGTCTLRTDFCYCRKGLQDALDAPEGE